jgi:hypothetical protein
MSDAAKLSNRARKKLQKGSQATPEAPRSESAESASRKDEGSANGTVELKPREGPSPFIDVVQKKIRNLTKRKVPPPKSGHCAKETRLEILQAQKNDETAPALQSDQMEALSHLPQVIAIIAELSELLPLFKKLEQADAEYFAAQARKFKEELAEAENVKEVSVKEAYERGLTDGRKDTKVLTGFLKYASVLRESPSEVDGENQAVEDVLINVYQGGDKGAAAAQLLADGSSEVVGSNEIFTCTRLVLAF